MAIRLYRMDDPIDKLESVAAPVDEHPDPGGHPLFPRPIGEVGPDTRRFDIIHIERWLPDGTKEVCPRSFSGKELRSWEQVVEIGGGECTYQLRAQCSRTYRYQAYSEKVTFHSPPRKPFVEVPKGILTAREVAPAQPPAPPPPAPPPPQPAAIPADAGFFALLNTLMQAQASNNAAFLNSNAAILKTILDRGQAQGPNPLEIFREVKPLLGGGGGATEVLKGIEIAKNLLPPAVAPAPAYAAPEEDLPGMLGGILKLIAPAQATATPSAQPSSAPAVPQSPPAMPPLAPPPPGFTWCYTAAGLSLMPAAQMMGTPPQTLRDLLADPATRDRLRSMLAEHEPPPPQPQAVPVAPQAAPVAGNAPPSSEAATLEPPPELAGLFNSISSLLSPKKPIPGES